jgi:DNA-directed RNA polymerase subunit H (RpoH/RPB5)
MTDVFEKLYIVKKNQIKMLQRRGYTVPDSEIYDMTFPQFKTYLLKKFEDANESPFFLLNSEITTPTKLLVWYFPTIGKDVPIQDIYDLISYITDEKGQTKLFTHLLLISDQKLGSKSGQRLDEFTNFTLEHFRYDELMYDPTSHFLASKHTRLSNQERKEFYKVNNVTPSQLPQIYDNDPISKYYNYQVGDLIFIERSTLIANIPDESISYRVVIKAPIK